MISGVLTMKTYNVGEQNFEERLGTQGTLCAMNKSKEKFTQKLSKKGKALENMQITTYKL